MPDHEDQRASRVQARSDSLALEHQIEDLRCALELASQEDGFVGPIQHYLDLVAEEGTAVALEKICQRESPIVLSTVIRFSIQARTSLRALCQLQTYLIRLGRVPGLDMEYLRKGHVYDREPDREERIRSAIAEWTAREIDQND